MVEQSTPQSEARGPIKRVENWIDRRIEARVDGRGVQRVLAIYNEGLSWRRPVEAMRTIGRGLNAMRNPIAWVQVLRADYARGALREAIDDGVISPESTAEDVARVIRENISPEHAEDAEIETIALANGLGAVMIGVAGLGTAVTTGALAPVVVPSVTIFTLGGLIGTGIRVVRERRKERQRSQESATVHPDGGPPDAMVLGTRHEDPRPSRRRTPWSRPQSTTDGTAGTEPSDQPVESPDNSADDAFSDTDDVPAEQNETTTDTDLDRLLREIEDGLARQPDRAAVSSSETDRPHADEDRVDIQSETDRTQQQTTIDAVREAFQMHAPAQEILAALLQHRDQRTELFARPGIEHGQQHIDKDGAVFEDVRLNQTTYRIGVARNGDIVIIDTRTRQFATATLIGEGEHARFEVLSGDNRTYGQDGITYDEKVFHEFAETLHTQGDGTDGLQQQLRIYIRQPEDTSLFLSEQPTTAIARTLEILDSSDQVHPLITTIQALQTSGVVQVDAQEEREEVTLYVDKYRLIVGSGYLEVQHEDNYERFNIGKNGQLALATRNRTNDRVQEGLLDQFLYNLPAEMQGLRLELGAMQAGTTEFPAFDEIEAEFDQKLQSGSRSSLENTFNTWEQEAPITTEHDAPVEDTPTFADIPDYGEETIDELGRILRDATEIPGIRVIQTNDSFTHIEIVTGTEVFDLRFGVNSRGRGFVHLESESRYQTVEILGGRFSHVQHTGAGDREFTPTYLRYLFTYAFRAQGHIEQIFGEERHVAQNLRQWYLDHIPSHQSTPERAIPQTTQETLEAVSQLTQTEISTIQAAIGEESGRFSSQIQIGETPYELTLTETDGIMYMRIHRQRLNQGGEFIFIEIPAAGNPRIVSEAPFQQNDRSRNPQLAGDFLRALIEADEITINGTETQVKNILLDPVLQLFGSVQQSTTAAAPVPTSQPEGFTLNPELFRPSTLTAEIVEIADTLAGKTVNVRDILQTASPGMNPNWGMTVPVGGSDERNLRISIVNTGDRLRVQIGLRVRINGDYEDLDVVITATPEGQPVIAAEDNSNLEIIRRELPQEGTLGQLHTWLDDVVRADETVAPPPAPGDNGRGSGQSTTTVTASSERTANFFPPPEPMERVMRQLATISGQSLVDALPGGTAEQPTQVQFTLSTNGTEVPITIENRGDRGLWIVILQEGNQPAEVFISPTGEPELRTSATAALQERVATILGGGRLQQTANGKTVTTAIPSNSILRRSLALFHNGRTPAPDSQETTLQRRAIQILRDAYSGMQTEEYDETIDGVRLQGIQFGEYRVLLETSPRADGSTRIHVINEVTNDIQTLQVPIKGDGVFLVEHGLLKKYVYFPEVFQGLINHLVSADQTREGRTFRNLAEEIAALHPDITVPLSTTTARAVTPQFASNDQPNQQTQRGVVGTIRRILSL